MAFTHARSMSGDGGTMGKTLSHDQHAGSLQEGLKQSHGAMRQEQMEPGRGRLPSVIEKTVAKTDVKQKVEAADQNILRAFTAEGQELRRSFLKDSTIVFFGPGYPGKRFIYERANELGCKVVILDMAGSWAAELPFLHAFIAVDLSAGADELLKAAVQSIKGLGSVDAVLSFDELSVSMATRICETLGLPSHSEKAVEIARDKHATRGEMKKAGLPVPANALIISVEDVTPAADIVGFPSVLKPVSGAASMGVKKVGSKSELLEAYLKIVDEVSRMVLATNGDIVDKDDPAAFGGTPLSDVAKMTLMLEQYLDGDEVDVDVVMSNGEAVYAEVTDNGPTVEPYFNETWAVCPSMMGPLEQKAMRDICVGAVKCCGFKDGVFHVEGKLTSKGPQLIEVNCRMGGGPVRDTNLKVWGVDLVEEQIFAAAGIPSCPVKAAKPLEPRGFTSVNAPRSGVLKNFDFLKPIVSIPGVVTAKPMVSPGDKVVGKEDGMPTWVVDVMTTGASAHAALVTALGIEQLVMMQVPIE